jgi:hypothetical protein
MGLGFKDAKCYSEKEKSLTPQLQNNIKFCGT